MGGPSMRWVAPIALAAAIVVHAAILLLPAIHTSAALPEPSAMPDLPLVWRPAPPEPTPPPPALASRAPQSAGAPSGAPPSAAADTVLAHASLRAHALTLEPVPEPPPDLPATTIPAEMEAIIPDPDGVPPSTPAGPPAGATQTSADSSLSPIAHPPPIYPIAARSLRAEGHVKLELSVLPDGTVDGAVVESCSRPGLGFEAAALDAVKRWRYAAAPLQSGPRRVIVTVHFQRQEGRP
jgi:TonB family protein